MKTAREKNMLTEPKLRETGEGPIETGAEHEVQADRLMTAEV